MFSVSWHKKFGKRRRVLLLFSTSVPLVRGVLIVVDRLEFIVHYYWGHEQLIAGELVDEVYLRLPNERRLPFDHLANTPRLSYRFATCLKYRSICSYSVSRILFFRVSSSRMNVLVSRCKYKHDAGRTSAGQRRIQQAIGREGRVEFWGGYEQLDHSLMV